MDIYNSNPLILTLSLNKEAQLMFNNLRSLHFPAERNFLEAHLSLFHQLPANEPGIIKVLEGIAGITSPLSLQVNAVVSTGNGTAYKVESMELIKLHKVLQTRWQNWLIPQDKQRLWPHILVQNKVGAVKAKELQAMLNIDFKPFEIYGTGLSLWEYKGGPWSFIRNFDFTGAV